MGNPWHVASHADGYGQVGDTSVRRSLTLDEAGGIASNIAKLPEPTPQGMTELRLKSSQYLIDRQLHAVIFCACVPSERGNTTNTPRRIARNIAKLLGRG